MTDDSQQKGSVLPVILAWAALVVFAFHAGTHMVAAGDTWVALACGRHFVNHGVDTVEPFSANSHKPGPTDQQLEKFPPWLRGTVKKLHPTGWINQNWLTHVIYYRLVDTFDPSFDGFDGKFNPLVYWKFAVTFLTTVCVYFVGRVLGVNPLLAAAAACFAVFTGRSFIDIRPAVFSNLMTPAFMLVVVLATYRNIRYIWLLVALVVFWCNVHGGYIYAFIMLMPFLAVHLAASAFRSRLVSIGASGVFHSCFAAMAAFTAMIIFNPFHLTNLTHTFEISVSRHAQSWRNVNEWRPAFGFLDTRKDPNPVGDEEMFGVLCIAAIVVFIVWIFARFLRPRIRTKRRWRSNIEQYPGQYAWPKIDPAIILVASMTLYMAVMSRRFIPIGANVSLPVLALLVQEAVCMSAARIAYNKTEKMVLPAVPAGLKRIIYLCFAVIVAGLGIFWGVKYKRVYLDPWPVDSKRDSVFMRMSASNFKPIDACRFIRENNLSGNMFNHWTEGGAIAFGQQPDPQTGRIPLLLFMDGRAQAAYNHDMFVLWQNISAAGPVFDAAARRAAAAGKRKVAESDYAQAGRWIDGQLKSYGVWVILMPNSEMYSTFVISISRTDNWKRIYIDDDQQIFVDIGSAAGKGLYDAVLKGQAKFPDDYIRNLSLSGVFFEIPSVETVTSGFECAGAAFTQSPTLVSSMQLTMALRSSLVAEKAAKILGDFVEDFDKNQKAYAAMPGFQKKTKAFAIATTELADYYSKKKDAKLTEKYINLFKAYSKKPDETALKAKW